MYDKLECGTQIISSSYATETVDRSIVRIDERPLTIIRGNSRHRHTVRPILDNLILTRSANRGIPIVPDNFIGENSRDALHRGELAVAAVREWTRQYGGTDDQRQATGRQAQHRRPRTRQVCLQGYHGGDDRS